MNRDCAVCGSVATCEREAKKNQQGVSEGRSVGLAAPRIEKSPSFSAHLAKHPLLVSTSSRERTPRRAVVQAILAENVDEFDSSVNCDEAMAARQIF